MSFVAPSGLGYSRLAMSLALARKYRPKSFADVAVQSHVSNTLRGAIARGRVAHGYLLCGPRGVGESDAFPVRELADTGLARTRVIIAPADLRVAGAPLGESSPAWVAALYANITKALGDFPVWMESASAIDVRGRSKVERKF